MREGFIFWGIMSALIKAIIGLGNPGSKYTHHRHNIGFRAVQYYADYYQGQWHAKDNVYIATIAWDAHEIILLQPQTYMNASGRVLLSLTKKGIKPEQIVVVHDELELAFGKLKIKKGGSAKGHNGLRSIIETVGPDFYRLSWGISRPSAREEVPDYVLSNFTPQEEAQIPLLLEESRLMIQKQLLG